jgi:hypothetical protein
MRTNDLSSDKRPAEVTDARAHIHGQTTAESSRTACWISVWTRSGRPSTSPKVAGTKPTSPASPAARRGAELRTSSGQEQALLERQTLTKCIARLPDLGLPAHPTYQPGSRFWPLQLIATGFFLAPSACARGPASGDSTTLS